MAATVTVVSAECKPVSTPTPIDFDLAAVMGVNKDWPHPAEKDGWMIIHNGIRGAMADIKLAAETLVSQASAGRPLAQWQVQNLQKYWKHFETVTHHHHDAEEEIFFPWLSTRVQLPPKLTADHVTLMKMMDKCGSDINTLVCCGHIKDELTLLQNFLTDFLEFKTEMEGHLAEEDTLGLPLMRAYFTHKELQVVEKQIMSKLSVDGLCFALSRCKDADILELLPQGAGLPVIVVKLLILPLVQRYRRSGKGSLMPAIIHNTGSDRAAKGLGCFGA